MVNYLHAEHEPDNSVDEFAMKVVKVNETVGHSLANFVFFYHTWRKDARGNHDWLQIFSCLSKAKIHRLKEVLESKIY